MQVKMRFVFAVWIVTFLAFSTLFAVKPTVSISASPPTIVPGGSSTLTWTSSNTVSATINNGIGTVPLSGSIQVTPAITTKYTITVGDGTRRTASASVTVTISGDSSKVSITSFVATPASVPIGIPTSVNLSWTTINATSVTIDNNIGSVSLNGSMPINPVQTTTYVLTAKGKGGSITSSTTVTFRNPIPPTVAFSANPVTIQSGSSSTLNWNVANAQSIYIDNGIGSVAASGSLVVSPSVNTVYTLTASSIEGTTIASSGIYLGSGRPCYAYVPNADYDSQVGTKSHVDVIDLATNSIIKTINVDNEPQGILIGGGGTCVYFTSTDSHKINKLDPVSLTISGSLTGVEFGLNKLALHTSGKHLYAVGTRSATLSVVDDTGPAMVLRKVLTLPAMADGLAVLPDGSQLFVSLPSLNQILVLDTSKLHEPLDGIVTKPLGDELIDTIAVNNPRQMAFNLDGSRLFICQYSDLGVLDVSTKGIIHTYPNLSPHVLILNPGGDRIYVVSGLYYYIINADTLEISASYRICDWTVGAEISMHPDGNRIYFLEMDRFDFFDATTNAALGHIHIPNRSSQRFYGTWISYVPATISGQITRNDAPLPGATIRLEGEGIIRETQSDTQGNYHFAVKNGYYHLLPSYQNFLVTPEFIQVDVNGGNIVNQNFEFLGPASSPSVDFFVSPTNIQAGENATLSWDSTNATSAIIDNGIGTVPVDGTMTVSPIQTTTYTIAVTGPGGTATATTTVSVNSVPPPGIVFGASPTTIQPGQSSTLSWTSTNATSASIDQGIGSVSVNGSHVVTPTLTTIYTITAANSQGDRVTASATVTISAYDNSAKLTGTVTDYATSQPLADVAVSALDASGVPQTALTDATGKYAISNLRIGNVTASFIKTGYDPYQQTINIPANTTFDLTTQLHQILVGATLKGLVKDGQTNLPIVGATVIAVYSGSSQTATSAADGSYILTNIPLGVSATITASCTGYQSKTILLTFSQAQVYVWDFVIYDTSVLAIINGKITNAKTLLPEAGVKVTHEGSNVTKTTAADGIFIFDNIPFGEQTFYFEKTDFIEETYTCTIDRTPFPINLIKPSSEGGQITIAQNISGIIQDSISQLPIAGAKVLVPGLNLEAVSDANGNYSLSGLLIGTYPVIVLAVNHQAMNFMASVVPGETNKADFVLIPLANGLIKGTITDAATGEPVAGASIEIEGSAMLTAASEGDGTYKMVGVPPGTYKVLIINAEYADASVENVEVQDLTPTTVDLQLNKRPVTGALAGRILDCTTGNPVSGATVTVSGTMITATTGIDENYRLENVPAGLNDIVVSALGYPDSPRIRAVIADKDPSSPSTTSSDIRIDVGNSTVDEAVTATITANEGGDIITQDSRFLLHIFPGTLSADAKITLKNASDGPSIPIGSDLSLDPALGIEGIKAASIMTQIEISSVNEGNPAPTINGLAAFAARYAQKDNDTFQLDENTAFTYSWNGSYFTAMNPRPYELVVDKINNIVYSVMDLSKTIAGSTAQYSKKTLLTADPIKNGTVMSIATTIIIKIIGKSIKNTIIPPRPNIRIFDKNELNAVTTAPFSKIPNPNALPLLVIHGFDPSSFLIDKETNPNNEERYRLMLEDIVDATNGVYRPVFVSYNTEAKIPSIAQSLAEKIFGEYQNLDISFKGLPSDPSDPVSGTFPYLDTLGFSMGGLVSRTFIFFNKINRVHNMTMIGTPNHGTFNCLKYLFSNNSLFGVASNIVKPLNFGASDMLGYDDNNPIDGYNQNPFLFRLNSPILSSAVTPRGDMTLFAGNDESGYGVLGPFLNALLESPNDSLVPVRSVYCRPTGSTLESKLSLLKTNEPRAKKFEIPPKNFSHDNIGKFLKRISEFSNELALGFSDWIVERVYNENPLDNAFLKPTRDIGGYSKSKVKVEYNVWVPDAERQARDFDRVVLVVYHKDGNDHWHISEPKGGENGADVNGNVNGAKVMSIQGNSKRLIDLEKLLNATVNFEPNPPKGETGYDPEKDIVETVSLVIPLKPGKLTVPLDPTKAHFRTPDLNE